MVLVERLAYQFIPKILHHSRVQRSVTNTVRQYCTYNRIGIFEEGEAGKRSCFTGVSCYYPLVAGGLVSGARSGGPQHIVPCLEGGNQYVREGRENELQMAYRLRSVQNGAEIRRRGKSRGAEFGVGFAFGGNALEDIHRTRAE